MKRMNSVPRDHSRLLNELATEYAQHAPASAALANRAKKVLVDGGSHALRLREPFPPRLVAAQGAWIKDEDGHEILDFWQGHFANLLGHNPTCVTSELARAFQENYGLLTGFADRLQVETAEILCRQTGADRVRFTTSGALATMYAVLLARTFTQRHWVVKVGGGWHGAQPWGLKGVSFSTDEEVGFQEVDSAGLPHTLTDEVIITRFNDPNMLHDHFRRFGDRTACFIVEPFIGAGGLIPATSEYLQTARELTHRYGAVLIFDEVISGFRFHAGDAGSLFGIQPDLATFGKIIGGGMPVAAVAGRADILRLVGQESGFKVKFSGGTYSAHPASLLAAKTYISYLEAHASEIYPYLSELGQRTRQTVEAAFAEEGLLARCSGCDSDVLPPSSISGLVFPYRDDLRLDSPDVVRNPALVDTVLGEEVLRRALLLEDIHVFHGLGALTTAHTTEDIERLGNACHKVAKRVKASL